MMAIILSVVAILVAIFLFLAWQPQYKNLGTQQLPEVIRNLMVDHQNGGYFKLNFKQGKRWITIERLEGSDTSAILAIRIPRDMISADKVQEVRDTLVANGFEWEDESDSYSLIAIAKLTVDDIWPKDSGEKPSMAVMSVIHASDLIEPVRYNVETWGEFSKRKYERRESS